MAKKEDQTPPTPPESVSDSKASENKDEIKKVKEELKDAAKITGRENIIGPIDQKTPDPHDPDEVKTFLKEVRDMVKELFDAHKKSKEKPIEDPPKNTGTAPAVHKPWYDREII